MSFVIKCGNKYVAMQGSHDSYTPFLQHARRYTTTEAANMDKCGNETVLRFDEA